MTNFVLIHDEEHQFLDGIIEIPLTLSLVGLTAINKAYIKIDTGEPISTIEQPKLLGFLYQQNADKRSKPYPIVSNQQSINLDFDTCNSFLFIPTNRLIYSYGLTLYVAYDGANGNSESIDLSSYSQIGHTHSISDITGLSIALVDLSNALSNEFQAVYGDLEGVGNRLIALESSNSNSTSISLSSIPISANQRLQANKSYVSTVNNLICDLPSNASIGDFVALHNGNFGSFRINHGNSAQSILNNSTLTTIGIESGLILKPYGFIYLVYVGNNLWVSYDKNRIVNNWLAPVATSNQLITYIPSLMNGLTPAFGTTVNAINDGVYTEASNLANGLIVSIAANTPVRILLTSDSTTANSIVYRSGQVNDTSISHPDVLKVYAGDTTNAPVIYDGVVTKSTIQQTVNFAGNSNLSQTHILEFRNTTESRIALLEIMLYGVRFNGGEVSVG